MSFLALLAAGSASAQEWRYRVRPGDTVWDLCAKYVRKDVAWQRLQAHNAIADPYRLPPGSLLRIPVAWLKLQPAKARVLGVQGAAFAQMGSAAKAFAVAEGMLLGIGTRLRTSKGASLTLQFVDGSRLLLQSDSELILDKLSAYGATGMVDTRVRLPRGRTTHSIKRMRGPASRFIIETPSAMSSVRGTQFRVGSDGSRTQAEVLEGSVAVRGGKRQVLLKPGQGTASDRGGGIAAASRLLPAPEPRSIALRAGQLSWAPVSGAHRYRGQISATPDFVTLIVDEVSERPAIPLPALGNGRYHLRVRGIDANGIEGYDAIGQASVSLQPPFAIAPVDGSATGAERPRFRWASMGDGARYRFQLAAGDGGFESPLVDEPALQKTELRIAQALPPGEYRWRVAVVDGDGQASPFSDGVRFRVQPGNGPAVESGVDEADKKALHVRWPAGEAGQRYRFQLSRKPDFSKLEVDREIDTPYVTVPGLRSGTWYARTQAIDSDGYAGPFGPAQSIKLGCLPCRIAAIGGGAALLLLAL
ncbi:FecR domain-containing protein [Luteimonas sp. SX5]|uniref:FecR domain-containing protein n=1 Tax=Luteimonas galliterrae TaxID=2940486 RepID=A0ABT0ME21_9GAMM|nr:FecR domain-containing protein [Luteimonas galliterrae]MCL1633110.1 FecR domain-containing protein [Luteimonas galliterrae]